MRCLLLTLFLLAAAPLQAQQTESGTHIGIGVRAGSLLSGVIASDAFESGLVGGTSLLVPININGRFKIEPEVGYGRVSSDGEGGDSSTSQFTLGLGVMPTFPRGDFMLYAGGRLRYTKVTQEFEIDGPFGDLEVSASSVGIAPVVGGEYFFSRWFSLGAEAGIEYRTFSFGEDEDEGEDGDLSSIATLGSVIARFYLN